MPPSPQVEGDEQERWQHGEGDVDSESRGCRQNESGYESYGQRLAPSVNALQKDQQA